MKPENKAIRPEKKSIAAELETRISGSAYMILTDYTGMDMPQTDELKIVICSREDYQWSKEIIEQYKISEKCPILFSPCAESIDPRDLAEWILTDQLPIRFQMQIHKILWNNQPGR
jgi:7-carboxy-7-deazaguanine synthase